MQRLLYEAGGRCNGGGIYCNVPRESLFAAAYAAGDGLTVRGRDFRGTVFVYSAPSAELNVSLAAGGWRATLESSGEEFVILRTRQQSSLDVSVAFTVTARARGDVVRIYDAVAGVGAVGLSYATVPDNGSMGVLTVSGEGLIGSDAVYAGSRITFTATPEPEHGVFAWEGNGVNCPQGALECVVAPPAGSDLAVTARFARTYPAGYAKIPNGKRGGTLTAAGLVGADRVFSGVTVVFRARPTPGWFRSAWKGDGAGCSPSDLECVLTAGVDGLFVTVQFVQALLVEYQADPPDKRGGTLTATGLAADNTALDGARVTFVASPAYGWELAAWEGGVGGSCAAPDLECALTARADLRVTARFSPAPRVEVTLTPPDGSGGRVTLAGAAGNADGEDFVYSGGTATLTATPEFGWELSAWEGDVGESCAASDLECVLTVSADARVTALFSPAPRVEVTLTPPDGSGGRVTLAGAAGNADGEDFVYSGGRATLTAIPKFGWELSAWEGDVGSCAAPDLECVLTVSADARVTALFSPAPRVEVTLTPPDGSGGRVTLAGAAGNADGEDFVYSGGTATLTAIPEFGWELSAWEGDVGSCAAPDLECVLTVNADARVTALFSQAPRIEVALNPPNAAGGRVTLAGADGNANGEDFVYSGGRRP